MFDTRFNLDGTVTLWDCFAQQWTRTARPSPALLATLTTEEAARVEAHTEAARSGADREAEVDG